MNFLLSLIIAAFSIMPGMKYQEAEKEIGRGPDFKYEKTLDTITSPMKFGLYGWDDKTSWYCLQTTNDTVLNFYTFDNKKEYTEFITFKE